MQALLIDQARLVMLIALCIDFSITERHALEFLKGCAGPFRMLAE